MGKHAKPEEIVAKLRQFKVLTAQGKSIAEAARSIGVSEQTYYRWRAEFGSMKSDQVKRLKALELENTRLRRVVSDLTLDKLILTEAEIATKILCISDGYVALWRSSGYPRIGENHSHSIVAGGLPEMS